MNRKNKEQRRADAGSGRALCSTRPTPCCRRPAGQYAKHLAANPESSIAMRMLPAGLDRARFTSQRRGSCMSTYERGENSVPREVDKPIGYILMVDIAGYSKLPVTAQLLAVEFLSEQFQAMKVIRDRAVGDFSVNGTGDGFVLAVPATRDQTLPDLLAGAVEMIRNCQTFAPKGRKVRLEIKAAIYEGQFHFGLTLFGIGGQAIGHGMNMAARLCDLAAPSQLLVHETVVERLIDDDGEDLSVVFEPIAGNPCLDAPVKHGVQLRYRAVDAVGLVTDYSTRVRHMYLMRKSLKKGIGTLATWVNDALLDGNTKSPIRVSLWTPDEKGRFLACPEYRAVAKTQSLTGTALMRPSATVYSLAPAAGPLAKAFDKHGKPHWEIRRYSTSGSANYVEEWVADGVDRKTVQGFSRKPRSLVALPLVWDDKALGVLCIDTQVAIGKRELEGIAEAISDTDLPHLTAILAAIRG